MQSRRRAIVIFCAALDSTFASGKSSGTETLKEGQEVTVSCAEGDTGFVYDGRLDFDVQRTSIKDLQRPRTKVMLNLADPGQAFAMSFLPNDGVGLARMEFIINTHIKVHPLALLDFDALADPAAKAEIERLTSGYSDKPQFFVDRLAQRRPARSGGDGEARPQARPQWP